MTRPADWTTQLQGLAWRFTSLGITSDVAALTLAEAWGLFVFLRRMSGGADV